MAISLKPEHLKRYRDLARLAFKYGNADLVQSTGLEDALLAEDRPTPDAPPAKAEELAADLERMGPTFVKLGQLLSTRPDLLPPVYVDALARLQDRVEPFDAEEAERIVTEELGVRVSKAFDHFQREPMAAASLGQVHRATLRGGREVAVKVQRPGIRERIAEDLDALGEVAGFMDRHTKAGRQYEFGRLLEEFRRALIVELDYRQEAGNLETLSRNLAEFDRIVVPTAVPDYSTSRVLTMEYVRGRKITALSPLAHLEIDGVGLAEELFRAYLKQILVDGFFHADPHPGNVFLTEDRRVALLDVGMVGRLDPDLQQRLLRLILAISEGQGEQATDTVIEIGEKRPGFRRDEFAATVTELVSQFRTATAEEIQVGRIMLEVTRSAAETGLRLPTALSMLGRALLALDQVGRTLDPSFDPNASIQRNAADVLRRRMLQNATPQRMFSNLLEMNDFVQKLPGRLNRALDNVADEGVELRVRVPEEPWLLEGMQKIGNRITTGLVLAALIVSSAMMMRVETRFRLFGYPGIAMLLFLFAAVMGIILVLSIVSSDVRGGRGKRPPGD